jgi:hypothetical protein
MSGEGCALRVGTVTAVDNDKLLARVIFQDRVDHNGRSVTSDWLPVLVRRPFIPDYDVQPQRTEYESGGSGEAAFEEHKHDLVIKPWMPKVNEQVLCLYDGIFNGQGYVIGGIQAWR